MQKDLKPIGGIYTNVTSAFQRGPYGGGEMFEGFNS